MSHPRICGNCAHSCLHIPWTDQRHLLCTKWSEVTTEQSNCSDFLNSNKVNYSLHFNEHTQRVERHYKNAVLIGQFEHLKDIKDYLCKYHYKQYINKEKFYSLRPIKGAIQLFIKNTRNDY